MEQQFAIKKIGPISEYIGCSVTKLSTGGIKLSQPELIAKLVQKFGNKIKKMQEYNTPLPQGERLYRNPDGNILTTQEQT